MKEVCPPYKIPSMESLKQKVDMKFEALVKIYRQKFCEIKYFSVTCDVWSEMMTCRSFLGGDGTLYRG